MKESTLVRSNTRPKLFLSDLLFGALDDISASCPASRAGAELVR